MAAPLSTGFWAANNSAVAISSGSIKRSSAHGSDLWHDICRHVFAQHLSIGKARIDTYSMYTAAGQILAGGAHHADNCVFAGSVGKLLGTAFSPRVEPTYSTDDPVPMRGISTG